MRGSSSHKNLSRSRGKRRFRRNGWTMTGFAGPSVKAQPKDTIRTVMEVSGTNINRTYPAGIYGTVVECYALPWENYAVDLSIADARAYGGYRKEHVLLHPEQFEVAIPRTG